MGSLLLVEDRRGMRSMLTTALTEDGWSVAAASDGLSAIALLQERRFDAVLSDVCMPGAGGLEVLAAARKSCPSAQVVLMTAFGTIELAVEAMKQGARDFVTKPFDLDRLLGVMRDCVSPAPQEILGSSPAFRAAVDRAITAAATEMSVLLLGESGTGKELLARAVHRASRRRDGPFIPVNCAAIPSELLESELFGAEKGAFTGADCRRPGRFELASGGTVFLDEVSDLAPQLQGKLLRVLQEKEFSRVGGTEILMADVRVVSASNRDLEELAASGRFRGDLYYRLSEFPVKLPPLRERTGDIPALAGHFLRSAGVEGDRIDPAAVEALKQCPWPGNIRELRSIVLRAAALAGGGVIGLEHLELPRTPGAADERGLLQTGDSASREAQRKMIREALEKSGGNRSLAAKMLRISYRTLLNRLKELGPDS